MGHVWKWANSLILIAESVWQGCAHMNDRKNRNHLERGRDPFRLSEMVQRRESRARLTDDLQEGKLNMLFNRDHKTGPAMRAGRIFLAGFLSVLLAGSTVAQNSRNVPDVTAMSMEDLMNLQVTSVSKRTQKVTDAASTHRCFQACIGMSRM